MMCSSPITQWRISVLCLLSFVTEVNGDWWSSCGKIMSRLVQRLTSMFQNMIIWLKRVCWFPLMEIPDAARVISYLHLMNITNIMATADNWAAGAAIAKEVGINKVSAETDPLGKADRIEELQMKGMAVAMMGDGINDSPAMDAGDVGMAIGAGTDVAIEAAYSSDEDQAS